MLWFLIRLLLLVILFLLIKRLWLHLVGAVQSEGRLPPHASHEPTTLVRDPECGLNLPLGDALTLRIGKEILYFCSRECRDAYLSKNKSRLE